MSRVRNAMFLMALVLAGSALYSSPGSAQPLPSTKVSSALGPLFKKARKQDIKQAQRSQDFMAQLGQMLRNPVAIAIAIVLAASAAGAAEAVWPKNSASDLSVFVAMQKYRIYADHCSAEAPGLKPEFESRMTNLGSRIDVLSKGLLASPAFTGMKDKPVPPELIAAFKDSFHDVEHNLERLDAAVVCPKALKDFAAIGDESLKSELTGTFTAVQTMLQKLEKAGARQ